MVPPIPGPDTGTDRAYRGGGWDSAIISVYVFTRNLDIIEGYPYSSLGFRCAGE